MKVITITTLLVATVYASRPNDPLAPPSSNQSTAAPSVTPQVPAASDANDARAIDRLRKRARDLLGNCTGRKPIYPEDARMEREIKIMREMVKRNAKEERRCGKKWQDSMPPKLIKAYQKYLEWQESWLGKLMGKLQATSCKGTPKVSEPVMPVQRRHQHQHRRKGRMRIKRVVRRTYRVHRSSGGSMSSGGGMSGGGYSYSSSSGGVSGGGDYSMGGQQQGSQIQQPPVRT